MLRRLHRGAVAAASAAGIAVFASLGGAPASASTTQVLTTDVLPGLSSLTPATLNPSTAVEVGITFANPEAALQDAAYQAIYTPTSPSYHHFMTSQQVAADFGVPQATFAAVVTWMARDGMRPVFAAATHEYLLLQGTAMQADQTFSVTLASYTALGKTFYANPTGPTVPVGLDISGVIGLNNFLAAHTTNHPKASAPHGPTPSQSQCLGAPPGCIGLTTPQDLWSIYNQPTDLSNASANFGQGQQMAVLGEGNVSGPLNDLRAFEKEFGLPQIPITIASIGDSFSDTSGSGEWDIDSQASTGMSPKAYGETWIFANDLTDASVESDFYAFEQANGIMEANASFGECEEDPTTPVTGGGTGTGFGGLAGTAGAMFTAEAENSLQQATLQGKTLFSSTGDTGSSCPVVYAAVVGAGNGVLNQAYPETNYPASSRYAVAVGGTVLYGNPNTATPPASNATRSEEYAWTFTGGGNTFYIPEPSYQVGIPFLDTQDCISQPDGTPYATPTPCRGIPDVAAQSGDIASNGYAVTMGGTPDSQGAGTSLASPLWMGMWTRIQADTSQLVSGFHTNGFANVALYTVGRNATQDANDFFDIGGGTSSPPTSNGYYVSVPRTPTVDPNGWDYVSGLGSPNVCNLTKDIDGVTNCDTVTNNLTPPAPSDCGQPGLPSCTTLTCVATGPLWTNPVHTATDLLGNTDPQLSLLAGNMSLSTDKATLIVQLTVTNLTETVPTGAAADEWYMLWTYGSTTYFANAELTSVAAAANTGPTFGDGTVTMTGTTHTYSPAHTDTGKFTLGPNGVVEIDVPVANVGAPTTGADLQSPTGETDIEVGVPTAGGFLEKVDTGGPSCDYLLGTGAVSPGPGSNVPEAMSPLLLVLFGGLGLTVAAEVRRRRRVVSPAH